MSLDARTLAIISACFALFGCGYYPRGDEGHATSASKEQILGLLSTCHIETAKVRRGTEEGETEWVIDLDVVAQSKWDCLDNQSTKAGVIATTTARKIEHGI